MFIGVIRLIFITLFFVSCSIDETQKEMLNYTNIKPVPFNGYICGYKNSETYIQLPFFLPKNENISVTDITKISLSNKEQNFSCKDYRFSSYRRSKIEGYKISTLSFRVNLSEEGTFLFNSLKIYLNDGRELSWKLGDIEISVVKETPLLSEQLSMRKFIINQSQALTYKVSYMNNTDRDILIKSFSYPNNLCNGSELQKYKDFGLKEPETGLNIPPHEERTFLVAFNFEHNFSETKGQFFYMLPFLYYEIVNQQMKMPAQTQATVVQIPFTEEIISSIIE